MLFSDLSAWLWLLLVDHNYIVFHRSVEGSLAHCLVKFPNSPLADVHHLISIRIVEKS